MIRDQRVNETNKLLRDILDELRSIRQLLEITSSPYASDSDIPSSMGEDDMHRFMPQRGPTGPEQPTHLGKAE